MGIAVFSFWLQWKKKHSNGIDRMPPGPQGLPLVGYLPFLGKDVHQKLRDLARVYGPIYKLNLGRKFHVVLSSSSLIKEVLHDHDVVFAHRAPTIAALVFSGGGKDIASASYGPHWRLLRKTFVHEMLSNANIEASYSLRRWEQRKCIRNVYGEIGKPIHIGGLAYKTAANMVASMLWGGSPEEENGTSLAAELWVAASQIGELLGKPNMSDFFPFLARFDLQGIEKETKKVTSWIERIFDDEIKKQMDMDATKGVASEKNIERGFLQFLLEQQDKETSITVEKIKAMFMDIVVAGTDTTRATVQWVMAEMISHPEVLNKVQEELSAVVGNNIVEESHIPKLAYLNAALKETLRLHPVAPLLLPHCPSQSCTVGGYTIPKGARVLLNVYALHRDPQIWDNPNEFMPERFLNPAKKLDFVSSDYQYLPFGSGRRMCAGFPLAERMVMYVTGSFLHLFEWKLPNGIEPDVTEKFGIVLDKLTPLFAVPTPRFSNIELYA